MTADRKQSSPAAQAGVDPPGSPGPTRTANSERIGVDHLRGEVANRTAGHGAGRSPRWSATTTQGRESLGGLS